MLHATKVYVGLRLLLAVAKPELWRALDSFVELSTPMTSFMRLSEGLYLYNELGISPYSGGPCHVSPLLLAAFSLVPRAFSFFLFVLADVLAASALAAFASRRPKSAFSPEVVAAVYLFNPYSLLSSLAQSTNVFTNALVALSLDSAARVRGGGRAMVLLAIATSLSWYPLYLVTGIVGIAVTEGQSPASEQRLTADQTLAADKASASAPAHSPKPAPSSASVAPSVPLSGSVCKLGTLYVLSLLGCLVLAYVPVQSWDFLDNQFGTLLALRDLTRPNIGLWWYFFIELFDFFRPFFLGTFQLVLSSFVIPISIRFPKQPLFVLGCLSGILAVLKPYPEASDFGLYISLLVLNRPVFDLLEYRAVEALGMFYVTALAPAFYYLWIYVGSGNANFFYAITLVYTVTMVLLFADSTWAAIRLDYDGGKDKNLTQI